MTTQDETPTCVACGNPTVHKKSSLCEDCYNSYPGEHAAPGEYLRYARDRTLSRVAEREQEAQWLIGRGHMVPVEVGYEEFKERRSKFLAKGVKDSFAQRDLKMIAQYIDNPMNALILSPRAARIVDKIGTLRGEVDRLTTLASRAVAERVEAKATSERVEKQAEELHQRCQMLDRQLAETTQQRDEWREAAHDRINRKDYDRVVIQLDARTRERDDALRELEAALAEARNDNARVADTLAKEEAAPRPVRSLSFNDEKRTWVFHDDAFTEKLREAVNMHSRENGSNTPDFILATFLHSVLDVFDHVMRQRENWYGRGPFASGGNKAVPETGKSLGPTFEQERVDMLQERVSKLLQERAAFQEAGALKAARLSQLGVLAHWRCGRCDQTTARALGQSVGEEIPKHFDGCPRAEIDRLTDEIEELRRARPGPHIRRVNEMLDEYGMEFRGIEARVSHLIDECKSLRLAVSKRDAWLSHVRVRALLEPIESLRYAIVDLIDKSYREEPKKDEVST